MKELHLTKKDFRVEWFSGTGGGGQYRNKHQNCCRITHIETGLMATGQSNRERPANQKEAFNSLVRKIIAFYEINDETKERITSNNVVRTYHFIDDRVSDGTITKTITEVMDKSDIDDFMINALLNGRKTKQSGRM